MKNEIDLFGHIEITSDFDAYTIFKMNGRFITTSKNGYDNSDNGGHASLIAAIHGVNKLIKNEFTDNENSK